ncbi:hypothetical protein [Rhizobium sp. PAMB 3182]
MADTPYPIPRGARTSGVLVGDGSASYGPFSFSIFDLEDVTVYTKAAGADWVETDVTVTKTSGEAFDTFSITFDAAIDDTVNYIVIGDRQNERAAAVKKGTQIGIDALERELSKIAVTLVEMFWRFKRAVLAPPGETGWTIASGIADGTVLVKSGDKLIEGPSVDDFTDGTAIFNGAGVPDDGLGDNGDYYLRSNGDLYQKAGGSWGAVAFSLKGPTGDTGAPGADGADGANGIVDAASLASTINGAADEDPADTAEMVFRKADGSLIKRGWANVKTLLAGTFVKLTSATVQALTGGFSQAVVTLTPAAGVLTLDFSLGNHFKATLVANTSLVVSNLPASGKRQEFTLDVIQDATGGRTLSYSSEFKWPGKSSAPSITTTANAKNTLTGFANDTEVVTFFAGSR